jgi:iron complex outermembrane receptor protein
MSRKIMKSKKPTMRLLIQPAVLALPLTFPAAAQTTLPPVVITTPSPIARPAPPPPPPAATPKAAPQAKSAPATKSPPTPAQQPSAVAQQQAAPPPPQAPAPAVATAEPPPGVLIVADQAFVPVTVVPGREVLATQGANLADALQSRPGISATNFAPGSSRPVIRGFDTYRVRVQENGIGTHDVAALSEDHAVPIDPNAADRIEVVRGPATLRYGSQAIGGVVNATNSRIPEFMPRGGFTAEVQGGLSSVDRGRDGAFKATAGAGNFVVHADAFTRDASDYRTPHGRQLNSFVQASGYALGGSFVGGDGFMGLSFSRFESLYGITGGEAAEDRKRIDLERTQVQSRGEWRPRAAGVEAVRYWFGHTQYAHDELATHGGADEVGSRFTNRETEGRLEIQHVPVGTVIGEMRGAIGVQLGRRNMRGESFEGDSLLEPARTRTAAIFLFEELQLTRQLRLQGAVRYEQNNVEGIGRDAMDPLAPLVAADRTFKPLSGSLGFLYDLPQGVVLRATAQITQRAPDAGELLSKGVHEATETFEIGNPFIGLETARTFELGLRRARGGFRFDASVYHTRFDGFIFKRLTGLSCGEFFADCESAGGAGGDLKELRFEQRDATFQGAELIGQLDIGRMFRGVWGVEAQYDFVHARFDNGENAPRIPPHRLGGGLYYRDANWLAKVSLLHAFRQDRIGLNETPTDGYNLLNAELSYTQKLAGSTVVPEMTIGLKADNLLNEDIRNHVSFKKDEVLLPGTSVRLFGKIKLN